MGKIYNSLKVFFQDIFKENNSNKRFIPTLLVLLSVPLSNFINNIAIAILLLFTFFTVKKENIKKNNSLVPVILLYGIMFFSFFWSINREITLAALVKEIPLLIIPLIFLVAKEFTEEQKQKMIQTYSFWMVLLSLYYIGRACIRYFILKDPRVFFYHGENNDDYGLVPKLLNAIHVSVFVAVAFFHYFVKEAKRTIDYCYLVLLFIFLLFLYSKNTILIVLLLMIIYKFFFSKSAHKMRLRNLVVFGLFVLVVASMGKIKKAFEIEYKSNNTKSLTANVIEGVPPAAHYVSIKEAWTNPFFAPNDYFPGTAFRVYQIRIFTEIIKENHVFLTGLGLNASYSKIKEKAIEHNVYMGDDGIDGYQSKNFHNQYIQIFAELGFFGFFILLITLIMNVKNAYQSKDFVHFAFAFLMISLFLTESFLWRQRGVVFFTTMYCLFNSGITKKNSKVEQKTI